MTYYPVALALAGHRVVVVGGDDEAAAKVARLLPCGPRLTLVSPTAVAELAALAAAGTITWLRRPYHRGDLAGARLAVVCDPAAAAAARQEAEAAGVLLNVVDRPELCDFLAVAHFNRDGLQLAVHTSGKSAALSRRLRERLQARIGEPYAALTRTLGELRPAVRALLPSPAARRAFWLEVVDAPLLDAVEAGSFDAAAFRDEVLARARARGAAR